MNGDGEQRGSGLVGLRPPVLLLIAVVVVAVALLVMEPLGPRRADSPVDIVGSGSQLVVVLEPDSVRVGEPFILGLTLREEVASEVTFPPVLTLDDRLEQTGPVDVRVSEDGREWRAYYTLVAWQGEQLEIPEFGVSSLEPGSQTPREVIVRPPPIEVLSVLPPAEPGEEEPELREARPFLRLSGPAWTWLLALLALLPLWLWWRQRTTLATEAAYLTPGEQALRALAELRGRWKRNELTGAELFDGVEGTLRDFVAATRHWRPSRSLGPLGEEDETLGAALARSALVRFARLRMSADAFVRGIDAAVGFVEHESEPEAVGEETETADDGPETADDGPAALDSGPDADDSDLTDPVANSTEPEVER